MARKFPFKPAALGKMLFLVLLILLNAALASRLMWAPDFAISSRHSTAAFAVVSFGVR